MDCTADKQEDNEMTRDEAWATVGGLVEPGTIPGLVGYGWNISKDHCRRGRLLRKQPGTVCHECFAATWLYERPSLKEGMERRFQCMNNPRWVDAMVRLIKGEEIFRWFDSGDLQDVAHL